MLAVIGAYGMPSALANAGTFATIGMRLLVADTAIGMIGTPARMAICTNPPRPKRRSL